MVAVLIPIVMSIVNVEIIQKTTISNHFIRCYVHCNIKQDITNNFPQLWNKLPITVTNENNTNTFKCKLHKYLLDLD